MYTGFDEKKIKHAIGNLKAISGEDSPRGDECGLIVEYIHSLQERIAIMSEGGWHKITESTDSLPKETDSVDVWVYGEDGNGKPIVFRAIYSRWHFYDVSGRLVKECKITHWMYNKEPEPPKDGELE